ncbi:MAG: dTDP-4-dehydrorhamnose reductase [Bdellovibrionaceae bacterium]|nr:dTDP-4-dehydrorhamnose reductase [Pseudobdellovibrionaceae bacterium]
MDTSRIVVIGKSGQLARAFQDILPASTIFLSREDLNLLDTQKIYPTLMELRPSCVICAAAYTQVDLAESHSQEAETINALAPFEAARACAQLDIPLVHFSTDYVFDGQSTIPYKEEDVPHPLNVYGSSKLNGERLVQKTWPKHLIFRVTWLYSEYGKNFLNTMLRLGKEREALRVVHDQVGSPTYVADVAHAVNALLQKENIQWGLYHLTNAGRASWYEFAQEIFALARQHSLPLQVREVQPIATTEYPTPAQRPQLSLLSNQKYENEFHHTLRHWKVALADCMQKSL